MNHDDILRLAPALHALSLEACKYAGVSPHEVRVSFTAVLDSGLTMGPMQLGPPAPENEVHFAVTELWTGPAEIDIRHPDDIITKRCPVDGCNAQVTLIALEWASPLAPKRCRAHDQDLVE